MRSPSPSRLAPAIALVLGTLIYTTDPHPDPSVPQEPVTGSRPWVAVLCYAADPGDPPPPEREYYDQMLAGSDVSLASFWEEVSNGQLNLDGSVVHGWYTLPRPRSFYDTLPTHGLPPFNVQRAEWDCLSSADPDIHYPDFDGIMVVLHVEGWTHATGARYVLELDAQRKRYGRVLITGRNFQTFAHELGHGFGLHHSHRSAGSYGSRWDVMSGFGVCDETTPRHPQFGCIPVHTIAHSKEMAGWLAPERIRVAGAGQSATFTLGFLDLPAQGDDDHMARVPVNHDYYYTVEARRQAGLDANVPGKAVIIHRVETGLGLNDFVFFVPRLVVPDGQSGFAAEMWLPGETFLDPDYGIAITVDEELATGYRVTIDRGPLDPRTLTVSVDEGGGVLSEPAGIACGSTAATMETCSASFPYGTEVRLSAEADPALQPPPEFTGWSGPCRYEGTDCLVTLYDDPVVGAGFGAAPPQLFVRLFGGGQGTLRSTPNGIDCRSGEPLDAPGCSASFPAFSQVTLELIPDDIPSNPPYFRGWDVPDCGTATELSCTFTFPRTDTLHIQLLPGRDDLPAISVQPALNPIVAMSGRAEPEPPSLPVEHLSGPSPEDLTAGPIEYGGGQSGWLEAELVEPTLPTELTLQFRIEGLTVGTHRAAVPIISERLGAIPLGYTSVELRVLAPVTSADIVGALLNDRPLIAAAERYIDGLGNADGGLDLIDFLGWLEGGDSAPPVQSAAARGDR